MYRLVTSSADISNKYVSLDDMVIGIEDKFMAPTVEDKKGAIIDTKKNGQHKPNKCILRDKMSIALREDLEFQTYAATLRLSISPLEFIEDGILVLWFTLDSVVQTVGSKKL